MIADNILVLKHDIEVNPTSTELQSIMPHESKVSPVQVHLDGMFFATTERERIKSCLHDIRDICSTFRQLSHDAVKDMVQGWYLSSFISLQNNIGGDTICFEFVGVLAHIRPILDTFSGLSYELDEDQYAEHEACDPWLQHLLNVLEEVCRHSYCLELFYFGLTAAFYFSVGVDLAGRKCSKT